MKKLLSILLLSVLLCSCGTNDPEIPDGTKVDGTGEIQPTANFTYSPTNPYAGQTVSFSNSSYYAHSYLWDFGNNKTSTSRNPTITFNKGTWTVRLTVYNESKKKKDIISKTINILSVPTSVNVYMCKVNSISFRNTNGNYWDSSYDGPDILLKLHNTSGNLSQTTGYKSDVKLSDIPYSFNISDWNLINLSGGTYTIKMYDYDTLIDDWMADFYFNPKNYIPSYPSQVTLTSGVFSITLYLKWE